MQNPFLLCFQDFADAGRNIGHKFYSNRPRKEPYMADKPSNDLDNLAGKLAPPKNDEDSREEMKEDSQVIKLANMIFGRGAFENASDIYIYPHPDKVIVQMRIDGIVTDSLLVPLAAWRSLRQRFLVMANLDSVSRKPQVGIIRLLIEGSPLQLSPDECSFRV